MKENQGILWYEEYFTPNLRFDYLIKRVIFQGNTKFQEVDIVDLYGFGKTLFLDGKIQSAEIDEAIYHEGLVHPAIFSHLNPKKVLIIGGGEGATLREVLRHKGVKEVTMVDIDKELVDLCKKYLPEWSRGAFEDSRARVFYEDARGFVENSNEIYDIVISDLTEPLEGGPSQMLFTFEFYKTIYESLGKDGILVIQSGSAGPLYNEFMASVYKTLKEIFPIVRVYTVFVFSFQMPWGFVLASKSRDPANIPEGEIKMRINEGNFDDLVLYYPEYHKYLFKLPLYLVKALQKGRVLTDEKPFIWTA